MSQIICIFCMRLHSIFPIHIFSSYFSIILHFLNQYNFLSAPQLQIKSCSKIHNHHPIFLPSNSPPYSKHKVESALNTSNSPIRNPILPKHHSSVRPINFLKNYPLSRRFEIFLSGMSSRLGTVWY